MGLVAKDTYVSHLRIDADSTVQYGCLSSNLNSLDTPPVCVGAVLSQIGINIKSGEMLVAHSSRRI